MRETRSSKLFPFVILVCISHSLFAGDTIPGRKEISRVSPYQKGQLKLGLNLGYDYPYSGGMELSYLFNELIDVNMGFGLGFSGAKIGVGTRIYPIRKQVVSPFFGLFLYHASGKQNVLVSVNTDEAYYTISPDQALLLNAGLRVRLGMGHYITSALGYSISRSGNKAVYISGSTARSVQNFANLFATGGLSFNLGVYIKLSRGNYIRSQPAKESGPYSYPG